jgi:hypothetical protein
MRYDLVEPTLVPNPDFRHTLDRIRQELPVANDSQPPWALRDENVTARQKSDTPGMFEALSYRHEPEIMVCRLVDSRLRHA